jgi:hypothetical protein
MEKADSFCLMFEWLNRVSENRNERTTDDVSARRVIVAVKATATCFIQLSAPSIPHQRTAILAATRTHQARGITEQARGIIESFPTDVQAMVIRFKPMRRDTLLKIWKTWIGPQTYGFYLFIYRFFIQKKHSRWREKKSAASNREESSFSSDPCYLLDGTALMYSAASRGILLVVWRGFRLSCFLVRDSLWYIDEHGQKRRASSPFGL